MSFSYVNNQQKGLTGSFWVYVSLDSIVLLFFLNYTQTNRGGDPLLFHKTSNFKFFHVADVTLRIILPDFLTILAAMSISLRRTVVAYATK